MQKYHATVEYLTEREEMLEVQFNLLAGIYTLLRSQPDFAKHKDFLQHALQSGKTIEISIVGTRIEAVGFPPE